MAGLIKKNFPNSKVYFLGRAYTKEVIGLSVHVDEFLNYDDIEKLSKKEQIGFLQKINADVFLHVFPNKQLAGLAKEAGIPMRVGTTNRIYHWLTCNKLIKLSRKNSPLHEAQLNFKLLSFLNIETDCALTEIHHYYGFTKIPQLNSEHFSLIDKSKFNLILHPKSKGSAKEWGLANFEQLIKDLPKEKFKVFISGTDQDAKLMKDFLANNSEATNICGKMNLNQFIAFIHQCDGLVAASTGPLHIAAALNKRAIGLFSPKRPIHPGRWMPLGKQAQVLVFNEDCPRCARKEDCDCITSISPKQIIDLLEKK